MSRSTSWGRGQTTLRKAPQRNGQSICAVGYGASGYRDGIKGKGPVPDQPGRSDHPGRVRRRHRRALAERQRAASGLWPGIPLVGDHLRPAPLGPRTASGTVRTAVPRRRLPTSEKRPYPARETRCVSDLTTASTMPTVVPQRMRHRFSRGLTVRPPHLMSYWTTVNGCEVLGSNFHFCPLA